MNCILCKKIFHNRQRSALYCSRNCQMKAFKLRNPGKFQEYNKRYFAQHPRIRKPTTILCAICQTPFLQKRKDVLFCSVICYRKNYYQQNKKKRAIYTKKWSRLNPDKIKAHKKHQYKTHKDYYKHISILRKAQIRNAIGSHTLKEWNDLKLKFNYSCACCKKQEPEIKLTRDHIIAISKGGTNYISNIQPYCSVCNGSKYTGLNCQRTH